MTVRRLTRIVDVIRLESFFNEGFTFISDYLKYTYPIETYRRILWHLVRSPKAWVGVTFDDSDNPICFACAHESTPLFAPEREFEISILWHRPGQHEAALELQHAFEDWCRKEEVTRYFVTTRRDNPSAMRCFQHDRYGLKRAYTVFKKELNHATPKL